MAKTPDPKKNLTLYGNLGADPENRSIPARTGTYNHYDPIIDDVVEREYAFPETNFLTYSICTGGYNDIPERWHYCVDWEGEAFRARKGDRVKLVGQFQTRSYNDKKTGEKKSVRQFVVVSCEIQRVNARSEVA